MTDKDPQEPEIPHASVRPIVKMSGSGGLSVAIWKRSTEQGNNYSVLLDRSYKSEDGKYVTTPYLRPGDLLRAEKLLASADDWIEQDRLKGRVQSSGQARS